MKQLNRMLSGRLAPMLAGTMPLSLEREEGQTLVEYALIIAFIAIVVLVAVTFLGSQISSLFNSIGSKL